MFNPIKYGIEKNDDKLIAKELEYFVNCKTCKTFLNSIRDSFLDGGIARSVIKGFYYSNCIEFWSYHFCHENYERYANYVYENIIKLIIEEDYVCGYVFPLC